VLYLSQCPASQKFGGGPLGLLNVLNYIALLPVVVFFYALCVFYVAFCLRLFTLVYVTFVLFVLRY